MENLVQAEFFLANTKVGSLKELVLELAARIETQSRIKAVVRFYDTDGELTRYSLDYQNKKDSTNALFPQFKYASARESRRLDRKIKRSMSALRTIEGKCRALAIERLTATIQAGEDVAVENANHTFRLLAKDEVHELMESISKTSGMWLFIFEPNDLLSDTNIGVATLM